MRSALYYPHTTIRSETLLKQALLLWDRIEYIVPYKGYRPDYPSPDFQEAAELVAGPLVPSPEMQKLAHQQIEELATGTLPDAFCFRSYAAHGDYEIYPQKLLPKTWEMLREVQIAGGVRDNADYPFSRPAGLTIMSILADCCAGTTRARLTDQDAAYATVASLLQGVQDKLAPTKTRGTGQFVSITLDMIDADSIDLRRLIEFRKRERKSGGHAHRDLRHRYCERMEKYVEALTSSKGTAHDADELRRQLTDDMKDDLAALRDELRFARNDVLFSKEMVTAAVARIGTIAAFAFGAPFVVEGVLTAVGAPVTVGGLLGTRNKYLATRRSILQKHPLAYLYALQGSARKALLVD